MPNLKNKTQINAITENINNAQAVFLVDYQGIQANDMTTLRAQIRSQGAQLQIVKNTLFTIALKQSKQNVQLDRNTITQTTAALYAINDLVTPLKTVVKYAKDNEKLTLKTGFYNGQQLSGSKLEQLSNLPDRQVLLGQVVGMIASPLSGLATVLNGNLQKIVIALSEIKKQKSN